MRRVARIRACVHFLHEGDIWHPRFRTLPETGFQADVHRISNENHLIQISHEMSPHFIIAMNAAAVEEL